MYSVNVRHKIVLDDLEAGEVVVGVLKTDYDFISKSINEMRNRRDLKSFEALDLATDIELREAIKTLLRYYMIHEDYLEFMELQRVYGNV